VFATGTGWRWPDLDALTLPQVDELMLYWKKQPPTHLLVATYMGYKGEAERGGDIDELVEMFGIDG
jgi:hypothetical protein